MKKTEAPKPSAEEFQRGRWDVARWAWVYLGIRLHPGQVRMAQAYLRRTDSGWRAQFLWLMIAAGNRAGKTLCLAVIILHSCVYRMGLQPPEDINDAEQVSHWGRVPYHWWHFAVEQGPAEQVFTEIALLLGGAHAAQRKGCPWADLVGGADKIALISDTGLGPWCVGPKERGEYAWIKLAPDLGGAEIHFRSTKQKSLGALGQNMHGVSFDEAGLETNLDYLVNEVLHARRLGTGGQFILISTPSVATSTDFQDLWATGDPEDPFQLPRRFAMRMSTRENIGFGIDQETFDALIDGMPEDWIAQNIDGMFIQALMAWFNAQSVDAIFKENLPEEQNPEPGKVYIQCLDPGLTDKCWSLVFKVTPSGRAVGVSIQRQSGKQTTRGIVRLGKRIYHMFRQGGEAQVETGVDTTALGGHMFRDLLEDDDEEFKGMDVRTVEFGGVAQVKRRMLSDARTMIDEGMVEMPASGDWAEVHKQLRNYKLLDRKMEQDLVMCIAILGKLLRSAPDQTGKPAGKFDYNTVDLGDSKESDGITSGSIRAKMRERRLKQRAAVAQNDGG